MSSDDTALLSSGLRIVVWNVLAPELLLYFWRSSYGLPLLPDASA